MHDDGKEEPQNESRPSDLDSAGSSDASDATARTDRFGFFVSERNHIGPALSDKVMRKRRVQEGKRSGKWVSMLNDWGTFVSVHREKLKRRIRKGIPDSVRGVVWLKLAGVEEVKRSQPDLFQTYCQRLDGCSRNLPNEDTYETIERDIDRTFPRHVLFAKNSTGQESLRRVLHAYSIHDPELGYCQGMGFIVGMFLTYMPEEDAFYSIIRALNRPIAPLRALYLPGMPGARACFGVFDRLMLQFCPRIHTHLFNNMVHVSMFSTQWFMTVYAVSFPFDMVTRVWDIFWHEGWKIVYRVALALLKMHERELLRMSFEEIMTFFRELPEKVDGPTVLDRANKIPLKLRHVQEALQDYDANPDAVVQKRRK